jgi:hypothetical protein
MLSKYICKLCIGEVSLIKSCLVPLFLIYFFLSRGSLSRGVFFVSKEGEVLFQKENTHLGGVIFSASIDKSFKKASLICFLHDFNVFLFDG